MHSTFFFIQHRNHSLITFPPRIILLRINISLVITLFIRQHRAGYLVVQDFMPDGCNSSRKLVLLIW
jgi:hypothetical protein